MKNKILRVFLAGIIALPMFTSVFAAVNPSDLLARLDLIAEDISLMKQEYNKILEDYPEVIDSLSTETKAAVENLADNLMADGIANTIETLKTELSASAAADADIVLDAIEDLETEAKQLIADNKDIVEDVKAGYSDLTVEQIQQVVDKVVDIVESLGATVDTTDTYNEMMTILDEAHDMALEINVKLEEIISNNVSTFESALSKQLIKELLTEIKAKDREAIIDTLIAALNNAEGGKAAKASLKEVLQMATNIKDKLMELGTLDEQDLIMFTDVQKAAVSDKIKEVEKDYVDFAKVLLDNYSEDYMDVAVQLVYNESVDNMIKYANSALDYYAKYKETIDSLSVSMLVSKLPDSLLSNDLVQKAGLMVALGFVDVSGYNRSYIEENFGTQIDNLVEYVTEEFVDYVDHITQAIGDEVDKVFENGETPDSTQMSLRTITAARFNTLKSMKALKNRVDTEILANHESIKQDIAQVADFVYMMYEENILNSMSYTLLAENDKAVKSFECDMDSSYIITNKFITTSDFTKILGVPDEYKSVITYSGAVNSSIKTGCELTIDLSDYTAGSSGFVVLGDIFADGLVDARDYMVIKNHIMDGETMSEASLLAADTYRDDVIDARDYMAIKNYIMDGTEISL